MAMKQKRLLAALLSGSLIFTAAGTVRAVSGRMSEAVQPFTEEASEPGEMLQPETEALGAEEPETEESETEEPAESKLLSKETAEKLLQSLQKVDPDELLDYFNMIYAVASSEEFRSLMKYTEVQELVKQLVSTGMDFMINEQEITEKVLQTLEVDPVITQAVMLLLNSSPEILNEVMKLQESDSGQQLLSYVIKALGEEETIETMKDLVDLTSDAVTLIR